MSFGKRLVMAFASLAVGLGLAAGCGSNSGGPATLKVQMVDAPDPSVESVNVTIERVEANTGSGWEQITTSARTLDLVNLLTVEETLGSISLPEGHYTQLRLFPGPDATMVDAFGTHTLTIPSGDQTGIKIPVDFTVEPGHTTTILLDFNLADSIVALGNGGYHLKPVIHAAVREAVGTISGIVVNRGGQGTQRATVTATLPPPAGSTDAPQVFTTITAADGSFKLWNLPPGTYSVTATFNSKSAGADGVVVNAGEDTNVGMLALQ